MKHLITKRTKALLVVLTLMISLSLTSQAQTIQIDSTFSSNSEIFPFGTMGTVYGLSLSGSVTLNSDTSMIRIILVDDQFNEYLVYEAYKYISPTSPFSFSNECDETCYSNGFAPYSLQIQVYDASIDLDFLNLGSSYAPNAEEQQEQAKQTLELQKVANINSDIYQHNMLWFADTNSVSQMSYQQKKSLFGDNYNMLGMDYYVGGLYDPIPDAVRQIDNSGLIEEWDWRNRHGADDPTKNDFYYSGNVFGKQGWMTKIKSQYEREDCQQLCYIYAPLGSLEAVANLYFNNQIHRDYDLSTQQVLDCNTYGNGDCDGGFPINVMKFIRVGADGDGTFKEPICYPPANGQFNCNPSVATPYEISFDYYYWENYTSASKITDIKKKLIEFGPMNSTLSPFFNSPGGHVMVMTGYGKIEIDDIYHNTNNGATITVDMNCPYLGYTYWIFKNSWGQSWGDNGYFYHVDGYDELNPTSLAIPTPNYYIATPIKDLLLTTQEEPTCYDLDNDGYYNWGIREQKSSNCPTCPDNPDSDDSEPRLGPFDENFYSVPVTPIMEVSENNTFIPDNSYYTFYDPDLNSQNNQLTLTFTIANKGSAQLNLIEPNEFNYNIQLSNNIDFNLEEDIVIHKIPMETGSTTFKITFTLNGLLSEPVSTLVTVQTNECDMDNYTFTLTFADCNQTAPTDYIQPGVTYWDGITDYLKFGDVVVKAGATLNITGDYAFGANANLYIEQGDIVNGTRLNGGIVIIDGGRLTSLCGTWPGVDVWGDKNQTQFYHFNYPSQAPLYQGLIKVINGGEINNAQAAIETIKNDSNDDPILSTSGGIVYVNGGKITDCQHGVVFYPYKNFYPTANDRQPNWSVFYKAQFYNEFKAPIDQIRFNGVDGIYVKGSTFENKYSISKFSHIFWSGICSFNSGFTVTYFKLPYPSEDTIKSSFTGFNYGIYATSEYMTPENFININYSVFEDNERGVYLSAINNPRIVQNEFLVRKESSLFDNSTADFDMIGLYLDNFTYGFTVEENHFNSTVPYADLGGEDKECAGITVNNSGPVFNELYNNTLDNLKVGIAAGGENRSSLGDGLCIKCNDFSNCLTDIYVAPLEDENGNPITGPTIGIAKFQGKIENGDPKKLAGNTFSILTDPNLFNFEKDEYCEYIKYTHHHQVQGGIQVKPDPSLNIDLSEDEDTEYSKELACPSNQGSGIDLLVEKTSLVYENILVNAYSDTLAMETDGGNTDQLNLDIATSIPDQTMQLRQQLLDESPYLSDTVMKSAIEKENVLPNAIIRDVLTANPQSAKSVEVLQTLDDRIDPMPDYMLVEVMQGENVLGEKEIIEEKLALHKTNYSKSLGKIERYYQMDTSNLAASKDSLGLLWSSQPYPESKYKLSFHYLSLNDSSNLFNTLNNIPIDIELTLLQENVHELYEDLFFVLWQTHSDTIEIDSTHVPLLTSIANNYRTFPGVIALNILISKGVIFYEEPVYFPDYYKSSDATAENMNDYKEESILKVFPNPAGNYCIVEYDLSLFDGEATIDIIDAYGRRINSFKPQNTHTQNVISLTGYSPGIYFVKLTLNNSEKESVKLIVGK
jgi:hypothetical protein